MNIQDIKKQTTKTSKLKLANLAQSKSEKRETVTGSRRRWHNKTLTSSHYYHVCAVQHRVAVSMPLGLSNSQHKHSNTHHYASPPPQNLRDILEDTNQDQSKPAAKQNIFKQGL